MPDFEVKDSGQRQEYDSGMRRDLQDGKPRFDLLIPLIEGMPFDEHMLTRAAMLMTRGAEKYGFRNWEKANSAEELDRFRSSAMRHLMQWFAGEVDEDHAAAVIFNLIAAITTKWKLDQAAKAASEPFLASVLSKMPSITFAPGGVGSTHVSPGGSADYQST